MLNNFIQQYAESHIVHKLVEILQFKFNKKIYIDLYSEKYKNNFSLVLNSSTKSINIILTVLFKVQINIDFLHNQIYDKKNNEKYEYNIKNLFDELIIQIIQKNNKFHLLKYTSKFETQSKGIKKGTSIINKYIYIPLIFKNTRINLMLIPKDKEIIIHIKNFDNKNIKTYEDIITIKNIRFQ